MNVRRYPRTRPAAWWPLAVVGAGVLTGWLAFLVTVMLYASR